MDFSKIQVKLAKNRLKISPLCKGWHRFLKNLGICTKGWFETLGWEEPALNGEPATGIRIQMSRVTFRDVHVKSEIACHELHVKSDM